MRFRGQTREVLIGVLWKMFANGRHYDSVMRKALPMPCRDLVQPTQDPSLATYILLDQRN